MASLAAAVSGSTFTGVKLSTRAAAPATAGSTVVRMPVVRASASSDALGRALIAGASSLLVVASANAATVKMGGDDGALAFFPAATEVKAGETITFTNNKAFPHNVVFDEDSVPAGVKVDDLSHEEYLNAPGESFTVTLKTPGTYEYYCEPHQGAGMKGKITVS